jgi:hypothetical protein
MIDSWCGSSNQEMVANVHNIDGEGPADGVDYKTRYRNLKRKLKFLIYVSLSNE